MHTQYQGQIGITQNDYNDDGEFGAGKLLLKMLTENQITSRAVFVVRYCHGQKIGVIRHECFKRAAAGAINSNRFNRYTRKDQKIEEEWIERSTGQVHGKGKTDTTRSYRPRGRGGYKSVFSKKQKEHNTQQKRISNDSPQHGIKTGTGSRDTTRYRNKRKRRQRTISIPHKICVTGIHTG